MKSMKEGNFIEELDLFGESISLPLRMSKDCLETYIREAVCIADEARHRGCDQFNGILWAPIKPLGLDIHLPSAFFDSTFSDFFNDFNSSKRILLK